MVETFLNRVLENVWRNCLLVGIRVSTDEPVGVLPDGSSTIAHSGRGTQRLRRTNIPSPAHELQAE
jgi:hypothetical protein